MNPAPFDYAAPTSLEEAARLMRDNQGAKFLAGGHALLADMRLHHLAPQLLIDLRKLDDLRGITQDANGLRVGAMTTYAELAKHEAVRNRYHALVDALLNIGDPQVRNRATLGGNLASGHPAADLAAVVLAYEASLELAGANGTRTLPAEAFFSGPETLELAAGEVITAVHFPAPAASAGSAYAKFRGVNNYALCGVAATIELAGDGTIRACRLAVTGAATYPQRLGALEEVLRGQAATSESFAGVVGKAGEGFEARDDRHASADYRRHLATVLAKRALTQAAERARG